MIAVHIQSCGAQVEFLWFSLVGREVGFQKLVSK